MTEMWPRSNKIFASHWERLDKCTRQHRLLIAQHNGHLHGGIKGRSTENALKDNREGREGATAAAAAAATVGSVEAIEGETERTKDFVGDTTLGGTTAQATDMATMASKEIEAVGTLRRR